MGTTVVQHDFEESGDWLKKGRARLLAHLVSGFGLGAEVDLIARGYRPGFGPSVLWVAKRWPA